MLRLLATITATTALSLTAACGTELSPPAEQIAPISRPTTISDPIDIPWCYGADTARNPRTCSPQATPTSQARLDFGDSGRG